jgi:polyhydroxyalkanoate synthase
MDTCKEVVIQESEEILSTITNLCNKLLQIYKTEFTDLKSSITFSELLEFLKNLPGVNNFYETLLTFMTNPNHKNYMAEVYKDFLKDYQEHKEIYISFKKQWHKILNFITTLEQPQKQNLIFSFNNWLDLIKQQSLLFASSEIINTTINSDGKNLLNGIKNCLSDLVINNGYFNIKTNDLKAFTIGKNLAATPGKIIYQNDLMELIQYSPTTEQVYKTPLLIIPPCINKYYVLDLSAKNSLVQWLVEQGFIVYMISWNNPGPELAYKEFSDYVTDGPLKAVDIITKINSCSGIHTVGYCIGGTLLGCMLSYMEQLKDPRILSATHFMSLLDFSNLGDVGLFINENILNFVEKLINKKGYFDGRLLSMSFNTLRPNDLIWPYFINNYLLDKPLQAFDVLYWNSDPTNLPANMYKFYLRNLCFKNLLCKPNGVIINGVPIDLTKVTTPVFSLAGIKDHITPWQGVYASAQLYSGPSQFVLSSSGHVKGLINPPTDNKYSFRINIINKKIPKNHQVWLKNSTEHQGSWWNYWKNWLNNISFEKINVKQSSALVNINVLRDAPGSYVLKKCI